MTITDTHGNYAVQCDACDHQSTARPVEDAARSWAQRHGWALCDDASGRDLCPWCRSEALMIGYWLDKEARDDPR